MPMSVEDFAARLVAEVPVLQADVDDARDDANGDRLLLHVLMGDVLRWSAVAFNDGDRDGARRCLGLVEHAFLEGDDDVKNAVSVSFCENAGVYPHETPEFIRSWPQVLQDEIAVMDAYLKNLGRRHD